MNLAQTMGVAAASLVMAMSANGVAPVRTLTEIAAEARARIEAPAMRGALEAAAAFLGQDHVIGEQLRAQAEADAYYHASEALTAQLAVEWNAADGTCASAEAPRAEAKRVEAPFDRAAWRHDLPDARIHIARRMARL
jgi:hypothetical protein